jgi:hypothetical protein
MNLLRVGFTPIVRVLLIYTAIQMKMCLIAAQEDGISMNVLKNVRAQHPPAVPIALSEFLRYHHFVWMKFKVLMQNPLTDVFDMPKAMACLCTERLGDCKIDALTTLMFSGVRAVRGWPGGFLFNIEPVCLNLATH